MNAIILASKSAARQNMLRHAGVDFIAMQADLNESAIIQENKTLTAKKISMILAKEKAKTISSTKKDKIVIGSDQVLSINKNIYMKAKNKKQAFERLQEFSGKAHILTSAVAVYKNQKCLFSYSDQAVLTMRDLSDREIKNYIAQAGESVTQCVGGYAIEGRGSRLFSAVKGDYFTILGMPLFPLLNFLTDEGYIKL